jgi:hypothetical protein
LLKIYLQSLALYGNYNNAAQSIQCLIVAVTGREEMEGFSSSSRRPVDKKQRKHAKEKNKPDLSTIEGSKQFILQQDKKKRKRTHDEAETTLVQPQEDENAATTRLTTHRYRDRAQERREGNTINQHEDGSWNQDELQFSPFVKGLDYSLLKRNEPNENTVHEHTVQSDREETVSPSKLQAREQKVDDISEQINWPSTVAKIAVLQFRKEKPTIDSSHRVDSFYPGRMFYVYELTNHGFHASDRPSIIRHSKRNIPPSNRVTYEWDRDVARLIWADHKNKLSSRGTDSSIYNPESNSEVRLIWNCKRPREHNVSSTVQPTDNNNAAVHEHASSSEWPQVDYQTVECTNADTEKEKTENLHQSANQNENDIREEDMDIFPDVDPTKVTWQYMNS